MSTDIDIDVATQFLDTQSEPDAGRYVFAYTIRISNVGEETAQLKRRHWIITDSNGKVQEVRGDGVVGEQPTLQPGTAFEYSSGAIIETPVGTMQGEYEMISADGKPFDATIEPFTLAVPGILQ
ncbi:MAG: Co2+/Mg2+ efflux protein ApaG [Pseudomonadota bacterium]